MNKMLLAAVLAATLFATNGPSPEEVQLQRLSGVVRLMNRFNRASGCPISDKLLLTNNHVVDGRPFERSVPLMSYRYESIDGQSFGVATPLPIIHWSEDLGWMAGKFKRHYNIAKVCPVPGDTLLHVGYQDDDKRPLSPKPVAAKLFQTVAGHMIYERSALEGSSGSCVLNDRDEIVGINAAYLREAECPSCAARGMAVAICGEWRPEIPRVE